MRVSQLLGHSTYTLTLNTYGDWIPAEQYADDLPEPPAPAKPAELPNNVVNLFARQAKWAGRRYPQRSNRKGFGAYIRCCGGSHLRRTDLDPSRE